MPSGYFAYIRVSTAKQGEQGVSLQEQRDAISRFAERNGLLVSDWFEERVTAAKRGRPVFARMVRLLRARKAQGVIIHKIDRSARNLRDWADLGELIDAGVEIHFANESLDLTTRGGRLSADIQAVVAADYIRNLREETRKGFYGRLKQGLYPLPAPPGYLNMGKGKPKEPDPATAPFVRTAFELYATGGYSLDTLGDELFRHGLRGAAGSRVSRAGLANILNNPFYVGLIRLRGTGETFEGAHAPLVSKRVFDSVQAILRGRTNAKVRQHSFLFRRLLECAGCGWSLSGERQKGHVYYRCHARSCAKVSVREEAVEEEVLRLLGSIRLSPEEHGYLKEATRRLRADSGRHEAERRQALQLGLDQGKGALNRLVDAFLERLIDKETFEGRKADLLMRQKDLEEELADASRDGGASVLARLESVFELAFDAYSLYETSIESEKRDLVETLTSNRQVSLKELAFTLDFPFRMIAERAISSRGAPQRARFRTLDCLASELLACLKQNPALSLLPAHVPEVPDIHSERKDA
ncbi:MAG TPA: recombinase family protein [Pyrinomonadaceae bacterium]